LVLLAISSFILVLAELFSFGRGVDLSIIIALVTAFFLGGTFIWNKRSAQARFGVEISGTLRTEEWLDKFKKIYHSGKLTPEAELALDKLEWIGIMIRRRIFQMDLVMELLGGLPLRIWYCLSSEIIQTRIERGHYAINAEYFAKKALIYQIKKEPMYRWTKLTKDNEPTIKVIDGLLTVRNPEERLIGIWGLRYCNLVRHLHALNPFKWKNLKRGYPFMDSEGLEGALINKKNNEILEIFKREDIIPNEGDTTLHVNKWSNKGYKVVVYDTKYKIAKSKHKFYIEGGYKLWYKKKKKEFIKIIEALKKLNKDNGTMVYPSSLSKWEIDLLERKGIKTLRDVWVLGENGLRRIIRNTAARELIDYCEDELKKLK